MRDGAFHAPALRNDEIMAVDPPMNYCPTCGSAALVWRIPPGDDRQRQMCDDCAAVHYRNPRNVAGCIAEHDGRLLLCRRSIEPRRGFWTFPAGFLENGESLVEAAVRETREEARAGIARPELYALFNLTHIGQVYAVFRGEVPDGEAEPGLESLETAWCAPEDIPWSELAFPVIHEALRLYLRDRSRGDFRVHMGDIFRREDGDLVIRHHDGTERAAECDFRRR